LIAAAASAVVIALMVLASTPRVSFAQDEGITLLRDAEIETYLRKISTPIFVAAGIDPDAVTIYLVGNEEMNAFVSGGQNLFRLHGLIAAAERPNELAGVLAHETGHMAAAAILLRSSDARAGAMLPMILGMVMGVGAIAMGSPNAGQAILAGSQTIAQANVLAHSPAFRKLRPIRRARAFSKPPAKVARAFSPSSIAFRQEEAMSAREIIPLCKRIRCGRSHRLAGSEGGEIQVLRQRDSPEEIAKLDS